MGRSAQSKATMGMREKDKQGFSKVPENQKFADDLGYMTKVKSRRVRGK